MTQITRLKKSSKGVIYEESLHRRSASTWLLDSEVASFRQATFGESTQIRTFIRFCIYFGYTPVPASTETRVRYSVFLARTHVASSVKQNLNVVRIIHLARGLKNPLEGSFHLKCVLKGTTRMRGRAPERKLPITPVILRVFHRYIDVRNAYDVTFLAACVVAWKITILGRIFVAEMWSSLSKKCWFRLSITRQSSAMNVRWKPIDAHRMYTLSSGCPAYIMGAFSWHTATRAAVFLLCV